MFSKVWFHGLVTCALATLCAMPAIAQKNVQYPGFQEQLITHHSWETLAPYRSWEVSVQIPTYSATWAATAAGRTGAGRPWRRSVITSAM